MSLREFQKVYERLGVVITERGESFYQRHMVAAVADLKSLAMLEEDDGRLIMFGEQGSGCEVIFIFIILNFIFLIFYIYPGAVDGGQV